jgi:hypothetical protein
LPGLEVYVHRPSLLENLCGWPVWRCVLPVGAKGEFFKPCSDTVPAPSECMQSRRSQSWNIPVFRMPIVTEYFSFKIFCAGSGCKEKYSVNKKHARTCSKICVVGRCGGVSFRLAQKASFSNLAQTPSQHRRNAGDDIGRRHGISQCFECQVACQPR